MGNESENSTGRTPDPLQAHVDAALAEATDETVLFHLRHAKQLIINRRPAADEDSAAVEHRAEEGA